MSAALKKQTSPSVIEYRPLTILSFGGGQDSTALLHMYINDPAFRAKYAPGDFIVIMADTGDEHPYTYEHVKQIKILCLKHGIEFHHLTSNMGYHVDSWPDLISPQLRDEGEEFKPTMVQLSTKTCTIQLKIGPIYKFIDEWVNERYGYAFKIQEGRGCRKQAIVRYGEEFGPIQVMIGFAAGEESRRDKSAKEEVKQKQGTSFWKHISRQFPLIDLGLDRAACQKYIASTGNSVPLPSNCMRCPYMSPEELLWLSINYPDRLTEWCHIEERKIARFAGTPKNHGVFNTKDSIRHKLEKVKAKYAHVPKQELLVFLNEWKMNHGCGSGGH